MGATQRRLFGAATAAVALLALSACGGSGDANGDASGGGGSDPAPASEAASPEADAEALAFAECMRDNGVDMPDPGPGQGGFYQAFHGLEDSYDQATLDQAIAACEDLFPTYAGEGGHGTDDESVLALAECLREQGLDVPDNLFEDGALGDIDEDELRPAMEECRDVWTDGGQ
jgi:hypothetical protein